jgi:hypothetical protein
VGGLFFDFGRLTVHVGAFGEEVAAAGRRVVVADLLLRGFGMARDVVL